MNIPGAFEPTWESLAAYRVPDWYEDGKFGIFLHWGVYSVPAFGNEWYPRSMYQPGSREFEHHVATYGPQDQFGYKDFIPRLTFAGYDPAAYAQLFREAGAKFVVPVAEHHDGFAMYDSALTEWCAAKKGPHRDVMGDLATAVRAEGLVFGLSSHRAENYWFFDGGRKFPSDVQDLANAGLYGEASPAPADNHDFTLAPPTEAHLEVWLARCVELVDKYRPQLVWFDWWINHVDFRPYLLRFATHYYNRAAEWGIGVAINYKYDAFPPGTAVFDVERGQLSGIRAQLWQNDTSVSKNSWGYIEGHDYKTTTSIVGDLVDVVSKNGALLLNIGPKPDGTIPEPEQAMLREIGMWLSVNGEAIYGTRPWRVFGEGPTEVVEGAFTDTKREAFTGQDIRFTSGSGYLYAIALAWPIGDLVVRSLSSETVESVDLLGFDGALSWHQDAAGLHVALPTEPVGQHAFAFRIKLAS